MSRKTERLVNLTIALLSTKRFLTKAEIFRTIEGYEGTPESMERMFERDKDDLRSIGISIEVGSFDPLFEDEPGYRIKPDDYAFQIDDLTSRDITILSLATQAWKDSALSTSASSVARKLESLGFNLELSDLPALSIPQYFFDGNVPAIVEAITKAVKIEFLYLAPDLQSESRLVEPYGLSSKNGFWYLVGLDTRKSEIRTFRLDRIVGDISEFGKEGSYTKPSDFLLTKYIEPSPDFRAVLRIRKDKASDLRHFATSIDDGEEWDTLTINYSNMKDLARRIIWLDQDVEIIEPQVLIEEVVRILTQTVETYG